MLANGPVFRVFLGEAGRHSRVRCSLTYYCAVTSPRYGRPPCPAPTPPGVGMSHGAPALGVRGPQHRCCTRRPCPRGTQLGLGRGLSPEHPLPRRAPKPGAKKGQRRPKAAKNGHPVTLSPPPKGVARSSPFGLEADDRFWQESETSESTAKTCPKLPSTGADRSPPVRPKTGLSAWPKGQFRGK